ncbi:MAG: hypothetical protein R2788_17030 [Saprospiraceae bacterium]
MLAPSTYSATVTDALGCTGTGTVTLSTPAPIDSGIDALARPFVLGQRIRDRYGHGRWCTQPYFFQWENAAPEYGGIGAGSYALTVTDSLGCTAGSIEILENTPCDN